MLTSKISTKLTIVVLSTFALVLIALTVLVQIKTSSMVKQLGNGEITSATSGHLMMELAAIFSVCAT